MNLLYGIALTLVFYLPSSLLWAVAEGAAIHSFPAQTTACVTKGEWRVPGAAGVLTESQVLTQASASRVVLLGEHHDNQAHHDWQLRMLQALHKRQPALVMGLEMLPKVVQPQIDRFLRGDTTLETFLEEVEWSRYWSFDAAYYSPLLNYARDQKIPVAALNVTREKVDAAVAQGWASAPPGMTPPAQATRPYIRHLVRSFQRHKLPGAELALAVEGPAFQRFVQKQLLWDRAMAERVQAQLTPPQQAPLVVAFIGSGHLMYGYGVPHQLASLGVDEVMSIIPWDRHLACSSLERGFADVVYGAE